MGLIWCIQKDAERSKAIAFETRQVSLFHSRRLFSSFESSFKEDDSDWQSPFGWNRQACSQC